MLVLKFIDSESEMSGPPGIGYLEKSFSPSLIIFKLGKQEKGILFLGILNYEFFGVAPTELKKINDFFENK